MVLGEWGKPAKWNRDAEAAGVKSRVFCASMCDLFEDHRGDVVDQQGKKLDWSVDGLRRRVFALIEETPWLEWQLLTKRPENVGVMVPVRWLGEWPANVLTGTSPCNEETANECVPHLLKIPGRHFLSGEPLLGPVDLSGGWLGDEGHSWCGPRVDWVIVGVESDGAKVGRLPPGGEAEWMGWAESIVGQCRTVGVPVFVKQIPMGGKVCKDVALFPESVRFQEFPT